MPESDDLPDRLCSQKGPVTIRDYFWICDLVDGFMPEHTIFLFFHCFLQSENLSSLVNREYPFIWFRFLNSGSKLPFIYADIIQEQFLGLTQEYYLKIKETKFAS